MIKSSKDTRYANDSVVTHDGLKFPCWSLPDLSSFHHKLGDDEYHKVSFLAFWFVYFTIRSKQGLLLLLLLPLINGFRREKENKIFFPFLFFLRVWKKACYKENVVIGLMVLLQFIFSFSSTSHDLCLLTAWRDWHWRGSVFWRSLWILLQGCWSWWENYNCSWPWWGLFEVLLNVFLSNLIWFDKCCCSTLGALSLYIGIWFILPLFGRRSFGSVLDVIPLADTVTKLTARCELCGKRAFFTLRKTAETQTELIGGSDVYMPVCRQHYVSGQPVVESTRNVLESYKVPTDSHI